MVSRSASEKVRPKKSYFSSACEYVKLPFSLSVPKKMLHHFYYHFHYQFFKGIFLCQFFRLIITIIITITVVISGAIFANFLLETIYSGPPSSPPTG
jgi:hypothetical protein